ncbi:unnamed protein product [Acanthosepion pharaonis]|uniref:Uncharacterized protein n=1 Tax=Acanthosepion pharaonis TaxID=158019 RepID=A0A812BVK0_ACAPH|nr:unnamed protein product [Sepia pharaonis]
MKSSILCFLYFRRESQREKIKIFPLSDFLFPSDSFYHPFFLSLSLSLSLSLANFLILFHSLFFFPFTHYPSHTFFLIVFSIIPLFTICLCCSLLISLNFYFSSFCITLSFSLALIFPIVIFSLFHLLSNSFYFSHSLSFSFFLSLSIIFSHDFLFSPLFVMSISLSFFLSFFLSFYFSQSLSFFHHTAIFFNSLFFIFSLILNRLLPIKILGMFRQFQIFSQIYGEYAKVLFQINLLLITDLVKSVKSADASQCEKDGNRNEEKR